MAKKPMPTIGVSDYTIIPIEQDAYGRDNYRAPVKLPGTVQVSPTDSGGSDAFDADNGIYEAETYLENIGHEITNADIPPEVEAMLRGLTRTNGVLDIGASILAPRFGVAWKILKLDGTHRYVLYYNGKYSFASNVAGKTRPSSGASEKQTALAKFTAMPNDEGKYYRYEDDAGLTDKEKAELLRKYMGAAIANGFISILSGGGNISENMGVYTWTKTDTLNAVCEADSGVVTISFDMLCLAESKKYTRFSITDKAGDVIISFKCSEYKGDGSYYEVTVGDYTSTDKKSVMTGLYVGTDITDYSHFTCSINLAEGQATLLVYNDVNNENALYSGAFTPNGVSNFEIHSNHTYASRCISVKNLSCSVDS